MNTLLKRFVGFSMGPVIGAFISFITIPITTHFVSPDEYGKASMFILSQSLIIIILYLGLDQAYTREYHETKNKDNLLKNSMILPLLLALFIFIVICFNTNSVSILLFGTPEYTIVSLLFGLSIIFLVSERFIMLSIRMDEKALQYSVLNILLKLLILIFTLIFVLFIRTDFLAVVYSAVFGQILANIYLIIRYRRKIDFSNFYLEKDTIIKLLKFGIPLIIAASLSSLLSGFDRIALRAWSTFFEIGVYTAALQISVALGIIQVSFTTFWIPTAYRWHSQQKDIRHFELVSNVVLLVLSIMFCFILLFKGLIVQLLGSDYLDSKYIIALLCLHPVMYTLSETTTLGIVFSRKSYYNIWVSVLSIIPSVLLNYLLIPSFGAVGAAIATGISYIIFFLARSYFSNLHWEGFSLKPHIFITLIIFIAAIINTLDIPYIIYINFSILLLILIIQTPVIKKIMLIYTKKDKQDWDFS